MGRVDSMYILGVSISKRYPFFHIGKGCVESGNTINMHHRYGNRKNSLQICGKDNVVESFGKVWMSAIRVEGHGNKIHIEPGCKVFKSTLVIIGNRCEITIRKTATCGNGCWLVVMGEDNHIDIGEDVMIADDVDIWASDSHAIHDLGLGNEIVNPSGSIDIHKHVWIGKRSTILKNVTIGENSVIGMASVVTKNVQAGCVAVGNPAHIVKSNVNWDRMHITI